MTDTKKILSDYGHKSGNTLATDFNWIDVIEFTLEENEIDMKKIKTSQTGISLDEIFKSIKEERFDYYRNVRPKLTKIYESL